MQRIFLIVFLIVFSSISLFGQTVTKEEYEVYAAVLKHLSKNDAKGSFVILNKTTIAQTDKESETVTPSEENPALKEITESKEFKEYWRRVKISKTDRDFETKNKISVNLQRLFPIKYQYWLVDENEINSLIRIGEKDFDKIQEERKRNKLPLYPESDGNVVWKWFYKTYPNAGGYVEFSRIGFSQNRRFARVDVIATGSEWFNQSWYILKKINGKWIIYTQFGFGGIA